MAINTKHWKQRSLFFLSGLLFISLGINITISSGYGVGGWEAADIGMVNHFGMSIGFWLNAFSCIYLLISSILVKERLKLECFITSIVLGFGIDLWNIIFSHIHIEPVYLQLLVFLIGISCTSLGAGLYLVSDFPVNPIDHMMVCISERFHISIAVSKYIVEGSGMALGLLLKGPVGIGTILMILVFGPMIQFFKNKSDVLLQKICK